MVCFAHILASYPAHRHTPSHLKSQVFIPTRPAASGGLAVCGRQPLRAARQVSFAVTVIGMMFNDWSRGVRANQIVVLSAKANDNALVLCQLVTVCPFDARAVSSSLVFGPPSQHTLARRLTACPHHLVPTFLIPFSIPRPLSPPHTRTHMHTHVHPRVSYRMMGLFGMMELSLRLVLARRQVHAALSTVRRDAMRCPSPPSNVLTCYCELLLHHYHIYPRVYVDLQH